MAATIKVILETGVIASTEKQKQTVLGLGLKHRHEVNTLKDTPAIRGMVNKVSHLVRILDESPSRNPWEALPAAYELGSVRQKPDTEKKKISKKVSSSPVEAAEAKPKAKAAAGRTKKVAAEKKTKTSTKKVKGK